MLDWLARISVGEWLAVLIACCGVAGWAINAHQKMKRAAEVADDLRKDFDGHLDDVSDKLDRFNRVEHDVEQLKSRLRELSEEIRTSDASSREERRMVVGAIDSLRRDIDIRMAEIRAIVVRPRAS